MNYAVRFTESSCVRGLSSMFHVSPRRWAGFHLVAFDWTHTYGSGSTIHSATCVSWLPGMDTILDSTHEWSGVDLREIVSWCHSSNWVGGPEIFGSAHRCRNVLQQRTLGLDFLCLRSIQCRTVIRSEKCIPIYLLCKEQTSWRQVWLQTKLPMHLYEQVA